MTPRGWALRAAVAVVLAVAGYLSIVAAMAPVLARNNLELAHRLAPWDGKIGGRLAWAMASVPEASAGDRRRADAIARQALRSDPTAVSAVAALGLDAAARGDMAGARRLFGYAERLSRRHLPTQLWAIEDAVGRGSVGEALRHYDMALRTSPESAELLFPVLVAASGDAAVRPALVRMLATRPFWGEPFIGYLASKSRDPRQAASLLLALRRAGVPVPQAARATVVDALARAGYADAAWSYYAAGRAGADRRRSRDPRFTAELADPSQLDWNVVETPGISTSIQAGEKGGVFDFSAPQSVGGPLLRQLQLLPPGRYRVIGHSTGIDLPDRERPFWLLACHDGRELGRVELPRSSQANGGFAGTVSVPKGCGIQTLQLTARPTNSATGLSGQIDRVMLMPVGEVAR